MKKVAITLAGLALLVIIGVSSVIGMRNRLVSAEETVNEAWAQVENVYQRRADLIPNLVSTVKGYASHERETLQAVIEARSRIGQVEAQGGARQALTSPEQFSKFEAAQNSLSNALGRLMVVVERYPDLKANENFLALQSQLEGTENRIAVERRRFNELVRHYNVMIRQFPTSLAAALFGFERKPFFSMSPGAEQVPQVTF